MKRKLLFIIAVVLFLPQLKAEEYSFAGGDGSSTTPFEIWTQDDLNGVRAYVGDEYSGTCFILMNDIKLDFKKPGMDNTYGWLPIGEKDEGIFSFSGVFDGNGKTISGFFIKREADDHQYAGLFSQVEGEIYNLTLDIDFIQGNEYVGGIAGFNSGLIQECAVKGGILQGNSCVGGLVGFHSSGKIINCFSTVTVEAKGRDSWVGGLVGELSGNIENSYFSGKVTAYRGQMCVGGLAGYQYNGTIQNCYVSGDVIANVEDRTIIGGLVGNQVGGAIKNSYIVGAVSALPYFATMGAIVGLSNQDISNCYFNIETAGLTDGTGSYDNESVIYSKTTQEMKLKETFSGWDFEEVWGIHYLINKGYPFLRIQGTTAPDGNYYTLNIETEGEIEMSPALGSYSVADGGMFVLTMQVKEEQYPDARLEILVNGQKASPTLVETGKYTYTLRNIRRDTSVVVRFMPNPSANEQLFPSATYVYSQDGMLFVNAEEPALMSVYALTGSLVRQQMLTTTMTSYPLSKGFYIVKIGNTAYKVVVK